MGDARDVRGIRGRAASVRTLARGTTGRQRLGAGVVAALLLTAPFGGLKAAEQPGPTGIEAGKSFEIGPYEVSLDRVVTVSDLAPQITPEQEGNRLIAVIGTVRNPGVRPEYPLLLTRAIALRDAGVVEASGGRPDSQVVSMEDGEPLGEINPGLTYDVAFVFEQEQGWERRPVQVETLGYSYLEEDPLTLDDESWLLGDDVTAAGEFDVKVNP